ncbi:MAG TPA: Asd/ArgC dimerization domain-containing protein [Acidobacteriaceae bacterium]|jgi:aspartate-semialdehyde dehydrogenase|nr:Asd/ArgC dimerization domain-containing protein [Acidobacteriaceae bacterium]
MPATGHRAVVIGASTLLGKELIEELSSTEPSWDVVLSDAAESGGQIVAAGDEPMLIQALRPDLFQGAAVAFFAENPSTTRSHYKEAHKSGAAVVDLTATLEPAPGVLVRSPWIPGGVAPDLTTTAVVPAHPAAVMLGIIATRLRSSFGEMRLSVTVLEPASQQGSRGVDEVHQQTVSLLGFHSLPQDVYDAQVAFNLRSSVGDAARSGLGAISKLIRKDLAAVAGDAVSAATAFQLIQAPVFHGYTMSVFVDLPAAAHAGAVRKALDGGVLELKSGGEESPTNQSVSEASGIQLSLVEERAAAEGRKAYWLWVAADNLKLAARHALACAAELASLRDEGDVQ